MLGRLFVITFSNIVGKLNQGRQYKKLLKMTLTHLKPSLRIDTFNVNVAERLNDDNFKLKEGEAIIYDDVDDVSDNDNLGYIEASHESRCRKR